MAQIPEKKEIYYTDTESSEIWSKNDKGFLEVKIDWNKDVLSSYKEKFKEKTKNIKKLKTENPIEKQEVIEKNTFNINNFFDL